MCDAGSNDSVSTITHSCLVNINKIQHSTLTVYVHTSSSSGMYHSATLLTTVAAMFLAARLHSIRFIQKVNCGLSRGVKWFGCLVMEKIRYLNLRATLTNARTLIYLFSLCYDVKQTNLFGLRPPTTHVSEQDRWKRERGRRKVCIM